MALRQFSWPARAGAALAAAVVALAAWQFATAQPVGKPLPVPPPDTGEKDPEDAGSALTYPKDRQAQQTMEAVLDYVKKQEWETVTRSLQSLLDKPEDSLLEIKTKTGIRRVSVRAEANRVLGELPKDGLEFYQVSYGQEASDLLKRGVDKGDQTIVADVAQRYFHTKAGAEATEWLATWHLDRGKFLTASLYFERLMSRPEADRLPPRTLFKAAVAARRSGDAAAAEAIWKKFDTVTKGEGLKIAGRQFTPDQLRKELDRDSGTISAGLLEWALFRGNAARNAQGVGGPPFLEHRFQVRMFPPESQEYADRVGMEFKPAEDKAGTDWILKELKYCTDQLERRQIATLPAFFPVAASNRLIFRTYDGVYAVALKDDASQGLTAGQVAWMQPADAGLHALVKGTSERGQIEQSWNQWYKQLNGSGMPPGPFDVFFNNSLIGSLSHDGQRAYFIDDLALPPHPNQQQAMFNGGIQVPMPPKFAEFVGRNKLKAVDLDTGNLKWVLGDTFPMLAGKEKDPGEFADCLFLGPPLPLAGKLFVLAEKAAELKLYCLDPNKLVPNPVNPADKLPEIVWAQPLGTANTRLTMDSLRRMQAVHLACSDGILVCPTNAGAILGVDLLSHSLVWAHSYREANPGDPAVGPGRPGVIRPGFPIGMMPGMQNWDAERWRTSAPCIENGKVVFTAYDSNSVRCLNLKDGSLLWKTGRAADDLFLGGVYDGKVLVVGKNTSRFLDLNKNGEAMGTPLPTGQPSGQGVASNLRYYLPVARSADSKEPEVCEIDLKQMRINAHTRSRKKEIPGNLVFFEGEVFSQNLYSVSAYPQLEVKLAEIDQRLKADPNDPIGLTERGELRLDKGDLVSAVADLEKALAGKPKDDVRLKARTKLHEALTDLLQRDFPSAEGYLDAYKDLCTTDVPKPEEVRRLSNYYCLVAKGREKQGKLLDAFDAYVKFGTLNGNTELVSVIDEPLTVARADVWAQGRITAMMKNAAPEVRKPLEEKILVEWKAVRDSNDLARVRGFVTMFGSLPGVGLDARLGLAERLMQSTTPDELLEAETHLNQMAGGSDPKAGARATEALARLMMKRGLPELAVKFYRDLAEYYPKVEVKDGKTGMDYFDELITDKRFLPFLEPESQSWNGRFGKPTEQMGQFPPMVQAVGIDPVGGTGPYFRKYRLALEMDPRTGGFYTLKVFDRVTNKEQWKFAGLPNAWYLQNYQFQNLRIAFARGHVLVLNLNTMVYAFDLIGQRKLWEYNLAGKGLPANNQIVQQQMDPDGTLKLIFQDGWQQRVGQIGVIEAGYIALQTREGLVALDPTKGTVLWTRQDVTSRANVYGDDENIYVVDVGADGTPGAGRAVRARDGVSVPVADFSGLLAKSKKPRVLGGRIQLLDDEADGSKTLRVYDILTGKDLWSKKFASGSLAVRGDDPNLVGVIEPDGKMVVFDVRKGEPAFAGTVKPEYLQKGVDASLFEDRDRYYVTVNKPAEPAGQIFPNAANGLRSARIGTVLYAFDKANGKLAWYSEDVADQYMVMDQFQDLPLALFAVQSNRVIGGVFRPGARFAAIDKRTGKLLIDKEISQNGQFYMLKADPAAGKIEMTRYDMKVTFETVPEGPAVKK